MRKRFTFQELHNEEVDTIIVGDVVYRADARVRQTRNRARFEQEAGAAAGVVGRVGPEDLDGHMAIKARVARPVNLAHAADSNEALDREAAEPCSGARAGTARTVPTTLMPVVRTNGFERNPSASRCAASSDSMSSRSSASVAALAREERPTLSLGKGYGGVEQLERVLHPIEGHFLVRGRVDYSDRVSFSAHRQAAVRGTAMHARVPSLA